MIQNKELAFNRGSESTSHHETASPEIGQPRDKPCWRLARLLESGSTSSAFPALADRMRTTGTATVHLLVAILLACPYVCHVKTADGMEKPIAHNARAGKCPCCCEPDSQDRRSCPDRPASRTGGACLCHGAVMDRHVVPPENHRGFVTYLPPQVDCVGASLHVGDHVITTVPHACHFPAADSGRAVRAFMKSLLL